MNKYTNEHEEIEFLEKERDFELSINKAPKMSKEELVRRFWLRQEKRKKLLEGVRIHNNHSYDSSIDSLVYVSRQELGL